jgi:hypothetical protein
MGKLGVGGDGPWKSRPDMVAKWNREEGSRRQVVAAHLNQDYTVQRRQWDHLPGIDVLTVRFNRSGTGNPEQHPGWAVLQKIKNRLAPDGLERFGFEVFPPERLVVDNHPLYHVWVMPLGYDPGFGLHPDQTGHAPL